MLTYDYSELGCVADTDPVKNVSSILHISKINAVLQVACCERNNIVGA